MGPQYLMGMGRARSTGKIILGEGRGYMQNAHSTSSCAICRKVKEWIFLWGTVGLEGVGG